MITHKVDPYTGYEEPVKASVVRFVGAIERQIEAYKKGMVSANDIVMMIEDEQRILKQSNIEVSDMKLHVTVFFSIQRPIQSGEKREEVIEDLANGAKTIIANRLTGKISNIKFGDAKLSHAVVAEGY